MDRRWLILGIVAIGCGGKLASTPEPEPEPIGSDPDPIPTPAHHTNIISSSSSSGCSDCGRTGFPTPNPNPIPDPEPVDAGSWHSTPVLNYEEWDCAPGAKVWMKYIIAAPLTGEGLNATCEGIVEFEDDPNPERGTMSNPNGTGDFADFEFNGASYCDPDASIPGHPHCSDLVYGSGKTEPQYCTIFAYCQYGKARATGFSW